MVLTAQEEENIVAIAEEFWEEAAASAQRYFEDAKEKYELTEPYFLQQSLHRAKTFWIVAYSKLSVLFQD